MFAAFGDVATVSRAGFAHETAVCQAAARDTVATSTNAANIRPNGVVEQHPMTRQISIEKACPVHGKAYLARSAVYDRHTLPSPGNNNTHAHY